MIFYFIYNRTITIRFKLITMNKRSFDYAIALVEYIRKREGGLVDIRTAAEELKLPYAYLEKVAQGLKRGGILDGRRGAGGGYRLIEGQQSVSIETLISFYSTYSFCPLLRKSGIPAIRRGSPKKVGWRSAKSEINSKS